MQARVFWLGGKQIIGVACFYLIAGGVDKGSGRVERKGVRRMIFPGVEEVVRITARIEGLAPPDPPVLGALARFLTPMGAGTIWNT